MRDGNARAPIGRPAGVAAALVALLAYSFLQVGLYGAFGPNAASEAVVYAGVAWAMAVHAGQAHVVAAATAQGPGLLFGLGGGVLSGAAQLLFLTSLFAAALAFHNCVWRYIFALGREGVLPAGLGRTGANSIPKAASLTQSLTGLAAIVIYAAGGWPPMTDLFFWLGTSGGFGIVLLLAVLRARRPQVYAAIGLGAHAVTGQLTPATHRAAS